MSNRIKSILALRGLTIREFSELLNMHESTIWRKINNKAPLTKEDIVNFSKVLDLTAEEAVQIFLPELLQSAQQNTTTGA